MVMTELKTYKELLEFGQKQLKGEAESAVEEHLQDAELNQMIMLNNYVYTIYSSNKDDKTHSIEFFCLQEL